MLNLTSKSRLVSIEVILKFIPISGPSDRQVKDPSKSQIKAHVDYSVNPKATAKSISTLKSNDSQVKANAHVKKPAPKSMLTTMSTDSQATPTLKSKPTLKSNRLSGQP